MMDILMHKQLCRVLLCMTAITASLSAVTARANPAQIAKGRTAFAACAACHGTVADARKLGPTLFKVVGRKAGSVAGYRSSPALVKSGKTWNAVELDAFLLAPRKAIPGNRMPYGGMANAEQRKALIAYLTTLK